MGLGISLLKPCSTVAAQQGGFNVDESEDDGSYFLKDDGLLISSSSLNPDADADQDSSWWS